MKIRFSVSCEPFEVELLQARLVNILDVRVEVES